MRVADKRGNKCYQASSGDVYIEILLEGGRKRFAVYEVSKLGLSINIEQAERSELRIGAELDGCMAWVGEQCLGQVDLLATEQIVLEDARQTNVWLDNADPDQASSLFWKLIYH